MTRIALICQRSLLTVLLPILCTALEAPPCSARNFYVRITGNDQNLGTNRNQAFRTIGKAAGEAGPGDTIHIGAGNYQESVLINGVATTKSKAWLTLLADQDGSNTGDKGAVVLRPPQRTWAIRIANSNNVLIEGLSIVAQTGLENVSYGCLSTNSRGSTRYEQCTFKNLTYSIRDVGQHQLSVAKCSFLGGRYGIYTTGITETAIDDCQFSAMNYGCIAYDCERLSVTATRFNDRMAVNSDPVDTRGIYAARTAVQVTQCEFDKNNIGIYGTALKSAAIDACQFGETTSYAVLCNGESLSISDSTVSKGNYGITLGDTSGQSAKLSNLRVEQMRVGIMAYQGDYDFKDVTLSDNTYGIYQRTGNAKLTLSNSDRVKFVNNQYAILTSHAEGEDAELDLMGQDFTGNDRGLVSYRTRVSARKCTFGGTTTGAYLWESPAVDIKNCTFSGNPADPNTCHYGLYVRSGDVELSQCEFTHARYGMMIHNTSDNPPRIRKVTSEHHSVAAMYLRDGTWTYTDSDKNSFRHSPRGVMAYQADWTIDNVTTSDSCQYPIMDYYGTCRVRRASTQGTTTGFYGYRSAAIDVDGLTATDFDSFGLRLEDCGTVKLSNCQSLRNGHGAYLRSTQDMIPEISNCQFSGNNGYGLLMSGTTLDPARASAIVCNDNQYGLRVIDRPLTLTGAMQIEITNNQYGVLCQRAKLTLDQFEMQGNAIGAYSYYGGLAVRDSAVTATAYGVIAYLDEDCEINASKFNDSAYGVYLRAMAELPQPIQINQTLISGTTTCGIYVLGDPTGQTQTDLRDCVIRNGRQGVVTQRGKLAATNVRLTDLSSVGINQASGSATIRACSFTRLPGSWSILARGDQCDVSQTSIHNARYGIALLTGQGSVTNSIVSGSDYGLYLRGADAKYSIMHTTVASAKYYGLLRYEGDSLVRNCIFDSSYYGIYDGKRGGDFDHQQNLVHAGQRPYLNTTAGHGEINEPPFFVDAAAGDYHLTSGSPAINSGADLSAWVAIDLDGNVRPSFRGFEMGAYEYMEPGGSLRVLKWDEVAR